MLGQDRQIGTLVVFMRDNFVILKGENGLRLLAYAPKTLKKKNELAKMVFMPKLTKLPHG